ncbi:MAG: hypothetical protein R3Y46_07150 [Opitutales bacterium]
MKFSKLIPIILCFIGSALYAEESNELNDIFSELANRKTTQEELKDTPEYQQEAILRNTSTSSFFIVGEDSFGFSQIREIITCAEGIIEQYLGLKIGSNNKINLRIIPFSDEKYDKQFYIDTIDNAMYLMLRWDKNLEYEAFSKFIMGAMLRKLSQERKLDKDYEVPYFLELSLSILLQERARAMSSEMAKKASETKLLSLKDTLNISREIGDIEQKDLSAYWNLIAINRFFKDKKLLRGLLSNYLFKKDDLDIYNYISNTYKDGDVEKYFKCIIYSELSSRAGGVMSMQDSAEELLRLSFIRKDSINTALGDKDIVKYSEDKEIRNAIKRRITEIKILLPKINPVYFNTLISLGEMFEEALNKDESAFDETRLIFINEFKNAQYLQSRAISLLNAE